MFVSLYPIKLLKRNYKNSKAVKICLKRIFTTFQVTRDGFEPNLEHYYSLKYCDCIEINIIQKRTEYAEIMYSTRTNIFVSFKYFIFYMFRPKNELVEIAAQFMKSKLSV